MSAQAAFATPILILLGLGLATTTVSRGDESACSCPSGKKFVVGMTSFMKNSDRKQIVSVEAEPDSGERRCTSVGVLHTEIHPVAPKNAAFYLDRRIVRANERVLDPCGSTQLPPFFLRDKRYQFVFGKESISIQELRANLESNEGRVQKASGKSTGEIWNAITEEDLSGAAKSKRLQSAINPEREFNRTSWVLTRRKMKLHFVGTVDDPRAGKYLVPLKETRELEAGEIGQVEAVSGTKALVRFYRFARAQALTAPGKLSRALKFMGGPYVQKEEEDLYSDDLADILEAPLEDIVELNAFLDLSKSDRT